MAVQGYFTTAPDINGIRTAPIVIDSTALATQMALPPMRAVRSFLADKTKRNELGGFAQREDNVYAKGEEIFIIALLDHVGRKMAGTPFATYEIGLNIEVRDRECRFR